MSLLSTVVSSGSFGREREVVVMVVGGSFGLVSSVYMVFHVRVQSLVWVLYLSFSFTPGVSVL